MKVLAWIISLVVIAAPAFGADLYNTGREAFVKKDYVTALKYLFAYRTLYEKELLQQPEFLSKLDRSIVIAERQLRSINTHGVSSGISSNGGSSSMQAQGLTISRFKIPPLQK